MSATHWCEPGKGATIRTIYSAGLATDRMISLAKVYGWEAKTNIEINFDRTLQDYDIVRLERGILDIRR